MTWLLPHAEDNVVGHEAGKSSARIYPLVARTPDLLGKYFLGVDIDCILAD